MKKTDLLKRIKKYGWRFLREGGLHEVWTNGEIITSVPRHREINEITAKNILKTVKNNPRK